MSDVRRKEFIYLATEAGAICVIFLFLLLIAAGGATIITRIGSLGLSSDSTFNDVQQILNLSLNISDSLREPPSTVVESIDSFTLAVHRINNFALDAFGLDHTPLGDDEPFPDRVFGHQLGPLRASRCLAIVHLALYEAAIAVRGVSTLYSFTDFNVSVNFPADPAAALYEAGRASLAYCLPSHADHINRIFDEVVGDIPNTSARANGLSIGLSAANAVIAKRAHDGSAHPEPRIGIEYTVDSAAGIWSPDPIANHAIALGGRWTEVEPFIIDSADQFRCEAPPALDSSEYAMAYDEAKALGGNGIDTVTVRDQERADIGVFWAYDGTPVMCAPPRLFNQISIQLLHGEGFAGFDLLRALTVINVAMADVGLASWDSKYHYKFWRPIVAIRQGDDDGNAATMGDAAWTPLGAPARSGNFTPPFPAYPSGHASFGGVVFQALRRFLGRDDVPFVFVSDELNGETVNSDGELRPYAPRGFMSLSQAEEENGQSRMYLGIHWAFDKTAGEKLGQEVADVVFDTFVAQ